MSCGLPSADQFLESIDADEWTEYLAFLDVEAHPELAAVQDTKKVVAHVDAIFDGGVKRRGNKHRKT
jgi:hypothetical protein